jgi:hypothetical protein
MSATAMRRGRITFPRPVTYPAVTLTGWRIGARKRDHPNLFGATWKWCRHKVAISVSLQMAARTFRQSARTLPVVVGDGDPDGLGIPGISFFAARAISTTTRGGDSTPLNIRRVYLTAS